MAQPGSPPTLAGTPLFFSDFLLVSSRDATKGRMKPKKYGFMLLLAQYATLFWAEVLQSETCNKDLIGLRFPQFLVLNVNS
jgi:hypothetical protein